jgi:hypothetical protein
MSVFSQDTLSVKWYQITKLNKADILFVEKNKILKEQGKSYITRVWCGKSISTYYFTSEINTAKVLNTEDISYFLSNNNHRNMEIYLLPPYAIISEEEREKYFSDYGLTMDTILLPPQETCTYYINEKDTSDKYVYLIRYLEGHAIRIIVENNYYCNPGMRAFKLRNEWLWKWSWYLPAENIPAFFVYLFYKCDIIDCNKPPKGFVKWELETEVNNYKMPERWAKSLQKSERKFRFRHFINRIFKWK